MTAVLKQFRLMPGEIRLFLMIVLGVVIISVLAAALVWTFLFSFLNLDPTQLSAITDGFRDGVADRARGL